MKDRLESHYRQGDQSEGYETTVRNKESLTEGSETNRNSQSRTSIYRTQRPNRFKEYRKRGIEKDSSSSDEATGTKLGGAGVVVGNGDIIFKYVKV